MGRPKAVAVSRARCLAVLVYSPALLRTRCQTPEQMRLVNALCNFARMATPWLEVLPGLPPVVPDMLRA